MKHLFDIEIAAKYGVNAAILLENLAYWIAQNEANRINFFDGVYWTYNSRRAYRELFPYMSERQIDTAFEKLIDDGIIITGDYNADRRDRTLWYALTEKGKSILHFEGMQEVKMSNARDQNVKPLPYINTNINTNNNYTPVAPAGADARFNAFWEKYPRKVDKRGAQKAFYRIKNLDRIFDKLLSALEKQKQSEQWKRENGRFIPNPTTWISQERWNDETKIENGSFDTDDFFAAAVRRTYGEEK